MFDNIRLNSLRGALIIGMFSSALAAPTLMSASHYAQDLPNQLEPLASAPVHGPHLAARTPGLDLVAGVQARELHSISVHNDKEWDQEIDKNFLSATRPSIMRQVPDEHAPPEGEASSESESKRKYSAEDYRKFAQEDRARIEGLRLQENEYSGGLARLHTVPPELRTYSWVNLLDRLTRELSLAQDEIADLQRVIHGYERLAAKAEATERAESDAARHTRQAEAAEGSNSKKS
ncbi:hypothetical protein EV360DRAFT_65848 [Lentinula raphanica]|nr:hypothetical protein EV360DRAFT_65848 [Lentinula raphanica]